MGTINIHSIFESISGEAGTGFPQGAWCTFIRFQGCDLDPHCIWCDTKDAQEFKPKVAMSIGQILGKISTQNVLITGGEPLAQNAGCVALLRELVDATHVVQVETNGAHPIPYYFGESVHWVVDYKCPSSGVDQQMLPWEEFDPWVFNRNVSFKFVVGNGTDVAFSLVKMDKLRGKIHEPVFIISPVDANGSKITSIRNEINDFDPTLLDYVIFSIQLHKITGMP